MVQSSLPLWTPEPGLRTPDSGPGRPAVPLTKSGLRNSGTLDSAVPLSPRTPELRNSGLWITPPPLKLLSTSISLRCFCPQLRTRKSAKLANLFQSWRWRCAHVPPAHAAGVVLNVSRMSERRCTQQGCLPSAYDLEIPEDLRHYARRHLPGSVCSRAGRPSTRLRSRGPSRA